MKIEYLADNIHLADDVAKKVYNEFVKGKKHDVDYDQVLQTAKNTHKTKLPIRLVALIDGKCVGTVSIVENDLKCRDYTPWLAALYVDEAHRGQKIGEKLIDCVKSVTADLGYAELYLRTEFASDYYRRLGWQFIEKCDDNYNLKPDVFKFLLND